MCHEWSLRLGSEEREGSRQLWDKFEQTRPLGDPEVTDEEPAIPLEKREPTPPCR